MHSFSSFWQGILILPYYVHSIYIFASFTSPFKKAYLGLCICTPLNGKICKIALGNISWNESYWHDCSLLGNVMVIAKAITDQWRLAQVWILTLHIQLNVTLYEAIGSYPVYSLLSLGLLATEYSLKAGIDTAASLQYPFSFRLVRPWGHYLR